MNEPRSAVARNRNQSPPTPTPPHNASFARPPAGRAAARLSA
jgi:hypothetical protein